jgi:hypothetical protein
MPYECCGWDWAGLGDLAAQQLGYKLPLHGCRSCPAMLAGVWVLLATHPCTAGMMPSASRQLCLCCSLTTCPAYCLDDCCCPP